MKIHEYQAKEILRRYGVPVLEGHAATSGDQAVAAAEKIGGKVWVVKSQIHAGGRGKGRFIEQVSAEAIALAVNGDDVDEGEGGVRLAFSLEDVRKHTESMLGHTLVTKQTGAEGKLVRTVFIEAGCNIDRELYLSVMLDRSENRILFMASKHGGMNIEDVAHDTPEEIHNILVHPASGMTAFQARQLAFKIGLSGKEVRAASKFFMNMYKCYMETDSDMVEINPLVVTNEGAVVALDCKMSFDSNAMYRQKAIAEYRDLHEEEATEIEAGKWGLSFVKLDGNIGCLVNGAGLAMSTMDIIQFKGAMPANFLDVGGGAGREQVTAAFEIITKDPAVKGILVNIFGGIMQCDVIAEGVIAAVKEVGLTVPLVVRFAGTNAELGKKILAESGLNITPATSLDEAASAIVKAISE
ncbi:MAG: ADP-forming succinate--CoA ligase subunit beta [Rhodobacterales bacterium]|nr:ADP-forming succinate--CoA ligase subunit beta [Rhodobacterales bacterium]